MENNKNDLNVLSAINLNSDKKESKQDSSIIPSNKDQLSNNSDKNSNDSFQHIFNKTDKKKDDDGLISNFVLQKNKSKSKVKPILGEAPVLKKTLEQANELKQKKQLLIVQIVFVVIFVLSLVMVGFFYAELSPKFDLFGPNLTANLTNVNKNLRSIKTEESKYRYLAAQLDLNAFSFASDEFLDKTNKVKSNPSLKPKLSKRIKELSDDLPSILIRVQQNLAPDIVIDTYRSEAEEKMTSQEIRAEFENNLKKTLLEDKKRLLSDKNVSLSPDVEQEIRLIENTLNLVGNSKLINDLKSLSTDDFQKELNLYIETLDDTKRKALIEKMNLILASTKSDVAVISSIKASRINWSLIIQQIKDVTGSVVPNFDAGIPDKNGLEVVYNGYDFDSVNDKIVLSGVTTTKNAKNFSIISDLIDAFEQSPHFKDVEMRSFSKSGNSADGFKANFKFDLKLEFNDSLKNKKISLEKNGESQSKIKRIN